MTDNAEPTTRPTEHTPEVEAHGSVLELQNLPVREPGGSEPAGWSLASVTCENQTNKPV
ncbi:hypothetical protein FBY35_5823 [Streptomyces sp. SLBN-118]|uniref:hypothetical protein n=1 Tax=Streptomyces sp. SLBN-118 TaxID=2768454 RepID=UPI0011737629|nr:hypothetical protein [Streptomyces sp. SLBN-118]TQK44329.1 hypothetical protein FBY35_5823 [Streptomyces sp. SLBN-118]